MHCNPTASSISISSTLIISVYCSSLILLNSKQYIDKIFLIRFIAVEFMVLHTYLIIHASYPIFQSSTLILIRRHSTYSTTLSMKRNQQINFTTFGQFMQFGIVVSEVQLKSPYIEELIQSKYVLDFSFLFWLSQQPSSLPSYSIKGGKRKKSPQLHH